MADEKYKFREIALSKRCRTGVPGVAVGEDFRRLQNLRHTDASVKGIRGMSKVNTTPLSQNIISAFHFTKDLYGESHVVVQAENSAGTTSYLYTNDTAIGSAGDFVATPLFTEDADYGQGRFSEAPIGTVLYCNGAESLVWGGDEFRTSAFINYDPGGDFSYDYTSQVRNMSQATKDVVSFSSTTAGIDANTKLMLHLDNSLVDSAGSLTVAGSVTYSDTVKVFGTHSASLNGSTSYISVGDSLDFDFSGGSFCVDTRIRISSAGIYTIYYQQTDANNYTHFYVNTAGSLNLKVVAASSEVVSITTASGLISVDSWYHVECDENDNDWYVFVDGTQRGYVSDVNRCANYTGPVMIGAKDSAGTYSIKGYLDEYRVSKTYRHTDNFEPLAVAYSSASSSPWVYLGSTRPIDGFKMYVKTANVNASTMTVDYWDGSDWASCTSIVDGTASGGVSLAQTGSISFDSTVTAAEVKSIDGVILYWYRINVTSVDSGTTIYHCSVSTPMQPIVDVWDGVEREILSFQWYNGSFSEYTSNVYEQVYDSGDSGTWVELDSMATNQYLLFGFPERMMGLSISLVGGTGNTTANTTATVEYWDGSDWASVGDVDDGTSENAISFANSGIMTWNAPSSSVEFQTEINKKAKLYYYKVSFSQALSGAVQMYYAAGIPAQQEIGAYKFPLLANDRAWLFGEMNEKRNSARCSATSSVDVWNGEETERFEFGDDGELVAAAALFTQFGSSLYNMIAIFKNDEMWAIVGNSPEDWVQYRVSPTVGCVAPKSLVAVTITLDQGGASNKNICIWQGGNAVYMFDGRNPIPISNDIDDIFERGNTTSINRSMISSSVGFWDAEHEEYHLLFASGSSTELDTEWVFDVKRFRWYKIERTATKRLQCGCAVVDSYGNGSAYGARYGYLYELENGATMDGESIVRVFRTGDIFLNEGSLFRENILRGVRLVCTQKADDPDVTVNYYQNAATSATRSWTVSQANSGYEIAIPVSGTNDQATAHSLEFIATTSTDEIGFEPIFLGLKYSFIRVNP